MDIDPLLYVIREVKVRVVQFVLGPIGLGTTSNRDQQSGVEECDKEQP